MNITLIIADKKFMPTEVNKHLRYKIPTKIRNKIATDPNSPINKDLRDRYESKPFDIRSKDNNIFIFCYNLMALQHKEIQTKLSSQKEFKCIIVHETKTAHTKYSLTYRDFNKRPVENYFVEYVEDYLTKLVTLTNNKPLHIIWGGSYGFYIHEYITILPKNSLIISLSDFTQSTLKPKILPHFIYNNFMCEKALDFSSVLLHYLQNVNPWSFIYRTFDFPVIYISKKPLSHDIVFDCLNNHIKIFDINPLYRSYIKALKKNGNISNMYHVRYLKKYFKIKDHNKNIIKLADIPKKYLKQSTYPAIKKITKIIILELNKLYKHKNDFRNYFKTVFSQYFKLYFKTTFIELEKMWQVMEIFNINQSEMKKLMSENFIKYLQKKDNIIRMESWKQETRLKLHLFYEVEALLNYLQANNEKSKNDPQK